MESDVFSVHVNPNTGLVLVRFEDDMELGDAAYGKIFHSSRKGERAPDPFAHNYPVIEHLLGITGVTSVTPYASYVRLVVSSNLEAATLEACEVLRYFLGWPRYMTEVKVDTSLA